MTLRNAPYYDMWQRRHCDLLREWVYLCTDFSSQYFAKLKRELESAGYEVTVNDDGLLYSKPVGTFKINNRLPGECFIILAV